MNIKSDTSASATLRLRETTTRNEISVDYEFCMKSFCVVEPTICTGWSNETNHNE